MGFQDSMKAFGKRFKLDSHHNIERFGIMFVVIVTVFSTLLIGAFFSARATDKDLLSKQAVYVNGFTTSKTNLSGTVPGVYVSPNKHRALVMMKFKNDTDVSSNASDYQGFLTGSDPKMGQNEVSVPMRGQIVVFGSSGYLGVLLEADEPMPQQILNLTMRAHSELVYKKGDPQLRKDLRNDSTFTTYDQWRIYFNPGGSDAQVIDALATSKLDIGAIYAELVTAPAEKKVREKMEDALFQMNADLARIDAFEGELAVTSSLDGDKLVNPRGDNPQEALLQIAGDEILGDVKDQPQSGEESNLWLRTDWVNPKGFDFDWRSGSVYEGYLDDLVPIGRKYGEFLATKAEAEGGDFNPGQIDWTLSDGRLLIDAQRVSTATVMEPLVSLKANLENAYVQYAKVKKEYQVTYPLELLGLEISLRNVETTYSINDADNAILIY